MNLIKWAEPYFMHPAWWTAPVAPTPAVFKTHREWAGAQPFATPGIVALAQWVINPAVHRCRIGKITLKQAT
jgi:hypothetical protein